MPYVKSISLHTTVNRSIAYILNPKKTENLLYSASLNCMTNAKEAYLQMKTVFEHYSGTSFNAPPPKKGKGTVKAIHYIQGFDPADKSITPELAHKVAKAFALKTFGENCQVVIATHIDKKHLHNHLIINTYGIDGEKYNANQKTLDEIRKSSDAICLAYGIKPYDKSKGKGKTIDHSEWEHKQKGTSWKQQLRLEIDRLVNNSDSLEGLLSELEQSGYEVKRSKYISIKAEGQERFVRTKTLGDEYSEESLKIRIRYKDKGADISESDDMSEMHKDYYKTIYSVSELAKSGQKVMRKYDRNSPYSPTNDLDVYKLSAQLTVLNKDNIQSIGDLEGRISDLKNSYEKTRSELNTLLSHQEQYGSVIEQTEIYFKLKDKPNLTEAEKLKSSVCKQLADRCHIADVDDLNKLRRLWQDSDKKIVILKESFKSCEQLYSVYADIAETYRAISKGDYISNLVEEERKRCEGEQKRKKSQSR